MLINVETPAANRDAVEALTLLLGGLKGMIEHNVHISDLLPILDADPAVESPSLSTLRLIGSKMIYHSDLSGGSTKVEPLVNPSEARAWLLKSKRAVEGPDGLICEDKMDHLGMAALAIASGTEPQYFTAAYDAATNNISPLSHDIVIEIVQRMTEKE